MPHKLIIFALPGLGAHHLANIVASCGRYNYPVDYTKYFLPTVTNAHFLCPVVSNPDILMYHFGSANDREIDNLCQIHSTQFIVIHLPRTSELAWSRIESTNRIDTVENHVLYDLEKIYKQQFLSKVYPGQWNTIMADDLFSDNVDKIIQSVESILNCRLDKRDLLCDIHKAWISKIKKNPDPYIKLST